MEGANGVLLPEVVAVAGLDYEVFLFGDDEMNLVVAERVALVRRVGEAVLVAQVFLNLGVDFVPRVLLGDLEDPPAGFLGNLLEDFLAVGPFFLPRVPAASAATPHGAAHSKSAGTVTLFLIGKQNGVDNCVGALRGGNRFRKSLFAAAVHAVGK